VPALPLALRPAIPLAADAILVGDPGRALMLAQDLIDGPKMSNHARGLWGYTGPRPGGGELTIQATGMGGPSAAVVLADLEELGVRRAVRVGTCAALRPELGLGEILVLERALPGDGVSRLLGASSPEPDPSLLAALTPAGRRATVRSGELPARLLTRHAPESGAGDAGAEAHDLQSAALLALGAALGLAVAALLVVAEGPGEERLGDEDLAEAATSAGRAAAAALGNPRPEG
jgi:uridine phosphorylase